MKKKDIITIIVCLVIFVVAGYFILNMLGIFGKKQTTTTTTTTTTQTQSNQQEFTGNIDNETLQKVQQLNDYGEATLDNIGRANPFGPL